jgi:predicted nucleic acid-binding protein
MKFTLDTNLYVHALEVGGSSEAVIDWVERATRPVTASRRVITPTHAAWKRSGTALSRLASERHMERRTIQRSLVNDALIAATCRENGVTGTRGTSS